MAVRRIAKELRELTQKGPPFCSATQDPEDEFQWKVSMVAPTDCPYEGGVFSLSVRFPGAEYPFKPPKISFITKIYHPNLNSNGSICDPSLSYDWSPALTVLKVLYWIRDMLIQPNVEGLELLEPEIAILYKTDYKKYVETATEWTQKYATEQRVLETIGK